MQRLNLALAIRVQKKHSYVGHVFEGRFKNFPTETESYLLECGRYIERNPVRAKMVKQAYDYPWSSARFYLFGESNPALTENPLYKTLGITDKECRKTYLEYLTTERPYESLIDQKLVP